MHRLGVDLFPNVTLPVVMVNRPYPGAGPEEVETLVSKVLEDEISTVSGIKRLSSINKEGISTVVAEFTLETDVKYAERQVRIKSPRRSQSCRPRSKSLSFAASIPADQPIVILALTANLSQGQLFDLADQQLRPKLEQLQNVGLVEILGGRKRGNSRRARPTKTVELPALRFASLRAHQDLRTGHPGRQGSGRPVLTPFFARLDSLSRSRISRAPL